MTTEAIDRAKRKSEIRQQRRTRNDKFRNRGWLNYSDSGRPASSVLSTIRIGDMDDEWLEKWDYSRGDLLFYDSQVIPKAGDIVIQRDEDGFYINLYEPVSRRVGPKKREPQFDADGFQLPGDPEFETVEIIDKSIIGVVMFDVRRRAMP